MSDAPLARVVPQTVAGAALQAVRAAPRAFVRRVRDELAWLYAEGGRVQTTIATMEALIASVVYVAGGARQATYHASLALVWFVASRFAIATARMRAQNLAEARAHAAEMRAAWEEEAKQVRARVLARGDQLAAESNARFANDLRKATGGTLDLADDPTEWQGAVDRWVRSHAGRLRRSGGG